MTSQGLPFSHLYPMGRPTDYKDEYCEQATKLCKLGATDKELGDFFEVDESTINNWKIAHPEFLESIKKGKTLADANVADRLYQRALGFEHDSEEIKIIEGQVERVPIRKIYPPDTIASIFWLKNRQKEKWRDKQEVEHRTPEGITVIYKTQSNNDPLDDSGAGSDTGILGEQGGV